MSIAMNDISSLYRTINSTRDVIELAEMLVHPERERPAVVVSTTKNGPLIRPADLANRLGAGVDVYLLGSAGLAYDFQDAMPLDTSVYGGAARCYPPGNAWAKNSSRSMIRLAYTDAEGRAAIPLLADDVAAMESLVPMKVTTSSAPRPAAVSAVEGVVSVILEPDGALIKLQDGIARIDTSALAPGISPQHLFSPSQRSSAPSVTASSPSPKGCTHPLTQPTTLHRGPSSWPSSHPTRPSPCSRACPCASPMMSRSDRSSPSTSNSPAAPTARPGSSTRSATRTRSQLLFPS